MNKFWLYLSFFAITLNLTSYYGNIWIMTQEGITTLRLAFTTINMLLIMSVINDAKTNMEKKNMIIKGFEI